MHVSRRTSELRLRAAVESSPSGLLMVDAQGRIVLVNREIERLFGYPREELLGKPIETLVPMRFREKHAGHREGFLADPKVRAMGIGRDLYGVRKDGSEVPVEIGLTPVVTDEGIFILGSVVDITARKRAEADRQELEAQLRQAQKLEAVGTLAGGIAHDFNNILTVLIGYTELLQVRSSDPKAREDLGQMLACAQRGRELVEKILALSRRQEVIQRPLALTDAVAEAVQLLEAGVPRQIETRLHSDPGTPRVLADATSVHQVLMNLATNAVHAMPEGGTLDVTLEPTYVRDSFARLHPELHEGQYALLTVADSGAGIEPSILERIFEPFFTTKAGGAGTGLGLAVVHGIMRDHRGAIYVDSEPGKGTAVRCYFPALEHEEAAVSTVRRTVIRGEGERILYLDDEPAIAEVGRRRLETLGYSVKSFTDPHAALAVFESAPSSFDAVLTDLSMPGLDGLAVATRLSAVRPGLPILLLTGYMDDLPPGTIERAGVTTVIKKPLTLEHLAEALHGLLHGGSGGAGGEERREEQSQQPAEGSEPG